MGRQSRENRQTRRTERNQRRAERRQDAVFYDEVPQKPQTIQRLEPATQNQRKALAYLETGTPVVFLTGSAGTGKSLLATYRASQLLSSGKISKVFLVRPAVVVGKSIGLLPGEVKDKLLPFFKQTLTHLEKFLGKGLLNYYLENNRIEMLPVEYLRGMSFEHCLVVAEECQNFTHEEMEMMLTRLGVNSTIIFTGDTKQHDLKGSSGMDTTLKLIDRVLQGHPSYMNKDDMDALDDGIGVVQFKPEDVVRGGLTRSFVKLFYYEEANKNDR